MHLFASENKSVTLRCDNAGIIGSVVSDTNDSPARFQKITQLSKDITEITLIGHSSEYYLKDDRNVSSLDPIELAKNINSLYTGKKTKLVTFRLVSCEVGLSINGKSFAQEFAKEMHKLGFTNLEVRAFNPPTLETPATGMRVATYFHDTMADAYVYRRKSDESKDERISHRLQQIEEQIPGEKNDQTLEVLKKEKNELLDAQSRLRLYVCERTKITEALNLPQNTFDKITQVPKASMTLDVALAITCLRYQRLKIDTQTNPDLCSYLDDCLASLQRHPTLNQQEITQKLITKVPLMTINATCYEKIMQNVNIFINDNRVLPPEESITNPFASASSTSKNSWSFSNITKLFAIFIYTCCNGKAPEEFQTKLDDVKQKIANSKLTPENHDLKTEVQNSLTGLKQFLLIQIQDYLDSNPNPEDEMHKHKNSVMIDLKKILKEQNPEKARNLLTELNRKLNAGRFKFWDKGLASKVAATKLETEAYIKQSTDFKP